jgi:MFS superfamily sulfate permease-like transporter
MLEGNFTWKCIGPAMLKGAAVGILAALPFALLPAAAGVAAAFIGATSKLMPTLTEKFPPPHGNDNPIVTGSLMLCGVTILAALLLTLYGLLRAKASGNPSTA